MVLNGLATIEVERGRPVQAEPLYWRALAIKERVLGPEHPEIGVLLNYLAVMHRKARGSSRSSQPTGLRVPTWGNRMRSLQHA